MTNPSSVKNVGCLIEFPARSFGFIRWRVLSCCYSIFVVVIRLPPTLSVIAYFWQIFLISILVTGWLVIIYYFLIGLQGYVNHSSNTSLGVASSREYLFPRVQHSQSLMWITSPCSPSSVTNNGPGSIVTGRLLAIVGRDMAVVPYSSA